MYTRQTTRRIVLGGVAIGGGAPVVVQSMTNTDTRDVPATLAQIRELVAAGCEIVRCAVVDDAAAAALKQICASSPVPVVADIHFDSSLALKAIEAGVGGIRINPGTLRGGKRALERLVAAAKERGVVIRVGANSGSLPRDILERFGGPSASALVEAALMQVRMLEELGFYEIKVSLKASSVSGTIAAYRAFATRSDYPLHLGLTEAGPLVPGLVKSAVAMGVLLMEGLGDTIRISLTADPLLEVDAAWALLRACGVRQRGVEIISCPTCGRAEVDIISMVQELWPQLRAVEKPMKVAVMGCVVNGPGEAREADIGIAGGRGQGVLFKKGKVVAKLAEQRLVAELLRAVEEHINTEQTTG